VPQWAKVTIAIGVIILVAIVLTWLMRRAIRRFTAGLVAVQGSSLFKVDQRAAQRTKSVSFALRSLATGVIWTVAVLAAFEAADINIGAFVTAASIIGGALAFGAQQIVRDLLAGIFLLAEDHYGVGDSVDLGVASGTVENISLRSTRLRDVEGKVWHIPNGVIQRAGNLSQEWAQAVLDIPITIRADAREAADTITRIARDVNLDPKFGPMILAEPEVVGLTDVFDDRYTIRLVVRTAPNDQIAVRREIRYRLLEAFQAGRLPLPQAGPSDVRVVNLPAVDQPARP
jgi:moderate conductance mechanosensitive channel